MEASAEHASRFQRLSGMFLHNETWNISFVQSASINLNADLLTPESYQIKDRVYHNIVYPDFVPLTTNLAV